VGALAVVEVVGQHAARPRGPRLVGGEDVYGTVHSGHLELGQQRQTVAVEGLPAAEAEPAAVPAVAELDLEDVLARPDQVGDVVSLVAQPVRVAGPAGREDVVAGTGAVELRDVDAVRGRVEAGGGDLAGHGQHT